MQVATLLGVVLAVFGLGITWAYSGRLVNEGASIFRAAWQHARTDALVRAVLESHAGRGSAPAAIDSLAEVLQREQQAIAGHGVAHDLGDSTHHRVGAEAGVYLDTLLVAVRRSEAALSARDDTTAERHLNEALRLAAAYQAGLSQHIEDLRAQQRDAYAQRRERLAIGLLTCLVLLMGGWLAVFRPAMRLLAVEHERTRAAAARADVANRELSEHLGLIDQHMVFVTTDRRGVIETVNEAFCRISGYSREELVGRTHRVISSGVHGRAFWREMWRTVGRGQAWRGDVCNRRKDGSLYWMNTTVAPRYEANGRIAGYFALRTDVTQEKELALRLQVVLDASLTAVTAFRAVRDASGKIVDFTFTFYNRHALMLAGAGEGGTLGPSLLAVVPDAHESGIFGVAASVVETRKNVEIEHPFTTPAGIHRVLHSQFVPLDDGFVTTSKDVTAERQAEDAARAHQAEVLALAASNTRLAQALASTDDAVVVSDVARRVVYCNAAFERMTGITAAQLLGHTIAEFVGGDLSRILGAEAVAAMAHNEPWSGRVQMPTARTRRTLPVFPATTALSTHVWADLVISPVRDDQGVVVGRVTVARDATAAVAREEEQAVEREGASVREAVARILQQPTPLADRLREVLPVVLGLKSLSLCDRGGIFVRRADRYVLELAASHGPFDPAFLAEEQVVPVGECLCGRAARDAEMIVSDHCHDDPRHERRRHETSPHGHIVVPFVHAGRSVGVLFLYTEPYPARNAAHLDTLRRLGDMLAIAIERDETERLLVRARQDAENAARAKGEFLATVSHEIRTPLNGVMGMVQLLLGTPLTAQQQEYASIALKSGDHLLGVINDVLDSSKIEAGHLELASTEFSLGDALETSVRMVETAAKERGLVLAGPDTTALPAYVQGDRHRFQQVVVNLLANAVKFTERGSVGMRAQVVDEDEQSVTVRVEVRDTGIGITTDAQARLFQPFMQAEGSATTRRYGGTGLGLSISRHIVALMGGEMGVTSVPGAGSTFWFTARFRRAERPALDVASLTSDRPAATTAAEPLSARSWARARVLLVDDNEVNILVAQGMLESLGLSVLVATDGAVALEQLREHRVDLVLMDCFMPVMDGYEATAHIRDPESAVLDHAVPVVALSASAMEEDRETALRAGMDDFLAKPLRQDALVAMLERWVGRGRHAQATPPSAPVAT